MYSTTVATIIVTFVLIITTQPDVVKGQSCSPVCQWSPWKEWNACSVTCGGGVRVRTRPLCCSSAYSTFSACRAACTNLGTTSSRDEESCNELCDNGGYISGSSGCTCTGGFYGSCCQSEIKCATPSALTDGYHTGSDYKYGKIVTYHCNNKYQLVSGDSVHTCARNGFFLVGYWSGSFPYCAFMHSCDSNPCQNGATCINGEDSYSCVCKNGYSGFNCEFDIQPPVYRNCSANLTVHSSKETTFITWSVPEFYDPNGHSIDVTSNYPSPEASLPWGDFIIQYVGTKSFNGLRSECIFQVSMRPIPCDPLPAPERGAFACNAWNSDYTEVCALFCEFSYMPPRDVDITSLYVCGATGTWFAPKVNVSCSEKRLVNSVPAASDPHYYSNNCTDVNSKQQIQSSYVQLLNSSDWSELCAAKQWTSQCQADNVNVIC